MADAASGSTAPPPQAGFGSSPPGGMGVTAQGFGQEGYVLDRPDELLKPQPEQTNFSVGVPYYLPFTTPYRDSWEIFREEGGPSIRQLTTMRRMNGQARALYRLLTMPALAALKNCSVIPPDGETGGTKESQFIHDMFFLPPAGGGMMWPFKRFIKQMMLSLFNGFSAWELIYWQPQTGPLKGKYTLREIGWRPSETLTFLLDGQGQFNGFRQRTFFQGRTIDVKIPRETALYFANEEAERPFYGVSMFESAFYHYDKITKLYFITHLAAQRKAVGTRVGTMPPNPPRADKEGFLKAMADLGLAQYIVVPNADWQVTVLNDSGASFDFLGLISHHMSQMSKSVLAQWFDDAQGGGEGDSTLVDFGKQSDVTFMMMLESFLEDMAQTINHELIPRFIDWNFGSGLYPQFKWGELTAEQKAAIQEIFTQLAAAGQQANVSPDFMIELEQRMAGDLGLDIDYDKIKADRKKQQALLEQQYGEGQTTMGINGVPQPLQQPGQFGQDMSQGGPGNQPGGPPGGAGSPSGIPPNLLPDQFQQVQASAGQLLDGLIELSRNTPDYEGAPA